MLIDTKVNNILFCGYPEMVNPIVDPCSSHAQSTPFYRSGYEKLCTILSFAIGLTASRKIELKNGVPFWTHNLLLLALPLLLSKIVIGDIKYYYHSHPHHHHHHHHHHPRRRHHRHHCYHYFYHSDYSHYFANIAHWKRPCHDSSIDYVQTPQRGITPINQRFLGNFNHI